MLFAGVLLIISQTSDSINICTIWYFVFLLWGISSISWAINPGNILAILVTLVRILGVSFFLYRRISDYHDLEIVLSIYNIAVIVMIFFLIFRGMILRYSFYELFYLRFGDAIGYNSNNTAIMAVLSVMICLHKVREKKTSIILFVFFIYIIINIIFNGI